MIVLGAAGFIGRWVARKLSDAGAELFLPVRDTAAAADVFAIYDICGNVCELDLEDSAGMLQLFRSVRPAAVFNLAGYGVDTAERDEMTAFRINARLPRTLCEVIAESRDEEWPGVNLIHAGTAMEYGGAKGDLNEDTRPRPTTIYGRSKLAGTHAITDSCRKHWIRGVTARLFSVYGPGEGANRLLPSLMRSAESRSPLSLTDGLHLRDFVYVEDAAEGLLRLGLAKGPGYLSVNVATGKLATVKSFVHSAANVLGIGHELLRFGELPTRPEEMHHEPVSVARLRKLTMWTPQTTFEMGIRKTLLFPGLRPVLKAAPAVLG